MNSALTPVKYEPYIDPSKFKELLYALIIEEELEERENSFFIYIHDLIPRIEKYIPITEENRWETPNSWQKTSSYVKGNTKRAGGEIPAYLGLLCRNERNQSQGGGITTPIQEL